MKETNGQCMVTGKETTGGETLFTPLQKKKKNMGSDLWPHPQQGKYHKGGKQTQGLQADTRDCR